MSEGLLTLRGTADSVGPPDGGLLRSFFLRTLLRLLCTVPLGFVLFVPPLFGGLLRSTPAAMLGDLDAFLTPICAWLLGAALVGSAVSSGDGIRGASRQTRFRATVLCVFLGVLLGLGLYGVVAWQLPVLLRHRMFPEGVPPPRALFVHPFLLTTPELFRVQAAFRAAGGYSVRIGHTQELRAWLSISMPVLALVGAAATLMDRPHSRILRGVAGQLIGCGFLFFAVGATVGPAVFLRPPRFALDLGWLFLAAVAAASCWLLWAALCPTSRPESVLGIGGS